MSKTNEPSPSLKALASGVLEKLQQNKEDTRFKSAIAKPAAADNHNRVLQKPAVLQLSSLPDEYEERLAIAEYDGQQSSTQAARIAYLDSFVTVLVTLPHDDDEGDWLSRKIVEAKKWLLDQGIAQPK